MDVWSEPGSDEDDVVIMPLQSTPQISKKVIGRRKLEHSANNNNDVNLAKTLQSEEEEFQNHCGADAGNFIESNENQSNLFSDHQEELPGLGNIVNNPSYRKAEDAEKMKQDLDQKEIHSTLNTQGLFPRNNSFPLGYKDCASMLSNENLLTGGMHSNKRLLPPINNISSKRKHVLSESSADQLECVDAARLPAIEGSPIKTMEIGRKALFEIGTDSEDEAFDTSTSSDHDPETSSLTGRLSIDFQPNDGSEKANISENLQAKLLHVLRLEEMRSSPTASTTSAPIFAYGMKESSSDDEDKRSTHSDSLVIRSRSASKKVHSHSQEKPSNKVQTCCSSSSESIKVTEKDNLTIPLDYELDSEETDDVSDTLSNRSFGILPGIPSHAVRQRNFLVGNLTKHGSLLGANELERYFPDRRLRLFVGTWNMQRKGIPRNLTDFLLPDTEEYLQDIYVIGVQESTQDQKEWEIKLQKTLGPNHVLAHSVSHGVLHLAVFMRRDLIWFCSRFEHDHVTTRLVSQIKTKGAVAISFQFFGTSMVFVTSHFHSGETRIKERIEDYNRIKEKLKLPKEVPCNIYKSSPSDISTRFDCTFWFGDLNFRVSQPHQIMQQEVSNPQYYDFKEVLKGDQLTAIKKRGRIFNGYTEPKIRFLPTYKFTPGTSEYDTSAKLRVPSYTDRILYKCKEQGMVTCLKYDSVKSMKKSDHQAVYGLFEVCLQPGLDSMPLGGGQFRRDVYEKAVQLRQGSGQSSSAVCVML